MKPPRRFKRLEELTPQEHLKHKRDGSLPETKRYRKYVREVHEDAGLDPPDDDVDDKDADEMTVEDHLDQLQRRT